MRPHHIMTLNMGLIPPYALLLVSLSPGPLPQTNSSPLRDRDVLEPDGTLLPGFCS